MKLLDQLQSIDKSKVAQDIANSFLIGFSVAAVPLVLPLLDLTSFGNSLQHVFTAVQNRAWLYHFFDAAFTGALSASIGLRLKSAFDHFTLGFYGSDAPVQKPSSTPTPTPKTNP